MGVLIYSFLKGKMIETADSEMSLFGAALNINQTALRQYCSSLSHSIQLIPVKLLE